MALSNGSKKIINNAIYERAYEIEEELSRHDFFLARMLGIPPRGIEELALATAIRETKEEIKDLYEFYSKEAEK